jgi:NAD(P)-dependent dehydrogenase (short-subunit alcohol dehydrogenase family)
MFTAPSILTARNSTYPFIGPSRHANRLRGKTVLITGAGRGLGRETALAFADAGARVVCLARRKANVDEVAGEINAQHRARSISRDGEELAMAVAANVADPDAAINVIKEVRHRWGEKAVVEILVANAGITRLNTFAAEDEKLESWWRVLEVNIRGAVSFIRGVLPDMTSQGSGVMISVTGTSGSQDIPFNPAYATSEAAMIKFNQDLRVELEGSGVYCYALHPRSVATDLGSVEGAENIEAVSKSENMGEMLDQFQALEKQTPDLAANTAVALCVEEDAKFLNRKYIDSQQDLEEVLSEAKKRKDGRIEKEKLYWLKMNEL